MICFDLLIGFLKVGLFAFGGAYGAIPLIRDVVLSYGWIEDEMLTYMIAVSESTPGPIMVNLATYVGSSQAGFRGALIATTAVVLPSFIIILLIMVLLKKLLKNPYVQAVLRGLKPCIIGIILATGVFMILQHSVGSPGALSFDTTAIIMTIVLGTVYFGSRKVLKNGISPIGLIGHAPSRGGIIASQCSNLRSPMLNSLREWGERRSTRVFREKSAKNASNFEGACTVTGLNPI